MCSKSTKTEALSFSSNFHRVYGPWYESTEGEFRAKPLGCVKYR
jgi:hypothetical protein